MVQCGNDSKLRTLLLALLYYYGFYAQKIIKYQICILPGLCCGCPSVPALLCCVFHIVAEGKRGIIGLCSLARALINRNISFFNMPVANNIITAAIIAPLIAVLSTISLATLQRSVDWVAAIAKNPQKYLYFDCPRLISCLTFVIVGVI